MTPFLLIPYRFFFLLVSFATPSLLYAQFSPSFTYEIEEEQLNPYIHVVYQKKNGYVLCGTSNGLYSFDGGRFTKIPFEAPHASDTVTALFEDQSNLLWLGFKSGRMAQLHHEKIVY